MNGIRPIGAHLIQKLALALTTVIFSVSCESQAFAPAPLAATQPPKTTQNAIDPVALRSLLGLVFVPANQSDIVKAKLSKEEAISKANQFGGPFREATGIITELGYLSNAGFDPARASGEQISPSLSGHPLVWIISYEGVEILLPGPRGSEHHSVVHEYNIVIDATTGANIMRFAYR